MYLDDQKNPKISILVPTYNQEDYIEDCLKSIFSQNINFNVEILVGDDNSKDQTALICHKFKNIDHPFFRYVVFNWDKNEGGLLNINKLLCKANGDLIVILEGDDYWINNDFLGICADYLSRNEEFSFVSGVALAKNNNKLLFSLPSGWIKTGRLDLKTILLGNFLAMGCTVFRKKYCRSIYPEWRQLPLGDWPLFIRLLLNRDGYILPIPFMVYRITDKGIWSKNPKMKKLVGTLKTANAIKRSKILKPNEFKNLRLYIRLLKAQIVGIFLVNRHMDSFFFVYNKICIIRLWYLILSSKILIFFYRGRVVNGIFRVLRRVIGFN